MPPVVEEWNLNHCTARKVQGFPFSLFIYYLFFKKLFLAARGLSLVVVSRL